jgi:hypothetical protein
MTIPEQQIQICRELAAIALKYELTRMTVQYSPGHNFQFGPDIHMSWEWGRHGEDGGKMRIESTVRVHTTLRVPDKDDPQKNGQGA